MYRITIMKKPISFSSCFEHLVKKQSKGNNSVKEYSRTNNKNTNRCILINASFLTCTK